MTSNQIAYMRAIEEARHNRAMEEYQQDVNLINRGQLERQTNYDTAYLRNLNEDRRQKYYINRSGLINAMDIAKLKSDTDVKTTSMRNENDRVLRGADLATQMQMNNARIRAQERMNKAGLDNAFNIAVINNENENARNRERVQGNIETANISANAQRYGAELSATAQRYGAELSASASRFSALQHAGATKYASDQNAMIAAQNRAQQAPLIQAQTALNTANASNSSANAWVNWATSADQERITNQKMQSGEMQAAADTFALPADIIGRYVRALVPLGSPK